MKYQVIFTLNGQQSQAFIEADCIDTVENGVLQLIKDKELIAAFSQWTCCVEAPEVIPQAAQPDMAQESIQEHASRDG